MRISSLSLVPLMLILSQGLAHAHIYYCYISDPVTGETLKSFNTSEGLLDYSTPDDSLRVVIKALVDKYGNTLPPSLYVEQKLANGSKEELLYSWAYYTRTKIAGKIVVSCR